MFWKRKKRLKKDTDKLLVYTKDGEIFVNPALDSSRNPLLDDVMRFMSGYMQGKTKEELERETEEYFRKRPADLVYLLRLQGKGIQFEEDYLKVLQKTLNKFYKQGLL